jgi:putative NIF3 family GTP cyclohydrolase 1 type 2
MNSSLLLHARFVIVAFFLFAAALASGADNTLTAGQVVERIRKEAGVPWRTKTVDTFKAGDPDTPVKSIACVMMATQDVLQRCVDAGANFVITHEPTFFSGEDDTAQLEKEKDPVYMAKQAFIKQHDLVIWRFHDHQHAIHGDQVTNGFTQVLGWGKYRTSAPGRARFVIPETTLADLAEDIRQKLDIRTLRFVGDPKLKVTKAGFSLGAGGFNAHRQQLQSDDVEVLLIGEGTEWEGVEYVADAVTQGKKKAMILIGHIPSEEAGMIECAAWLKTFVPEVPIQFVRTPEFFALPSGAK